MSPEEEAFRRRLQADPKDVEAWLGLGMLAYQQGHMPVALTCFEKAVSTAPGHGEAVIKASGFQIMAGQHQRAFDLLTGYLRSFSGTDVHFYNLGLAAQGLGRMHEALAAYGRAVDLNSYHGQAIAQISAIFLEQGHLTAALQYLEQAAALMPDEPLLAFNRGYIHLRAGDYPGARRIFDAILANDPANDRVRFLRAQCNLAEGDLKSGWADYEARRCFSEGVDMPFLVKPWWNPATDVKPRLLIRNRQGVGDQLLFLAMIPVLLARGAASQISFACDPRTLSLMRRSLLDVVILPDSEELATSPVAAAASHQFLLASLPSIYVQRPEDVPDGCGLIVPDPAKVAVWQEWVKSLGLPAFGFSWRGGDVAIDRQGHYMQLSETGALLARPDIAIVNLQYGQHAEETPPEGGRLIQPPNLDLKNDFEGVAALCAALKGVISADNTLASLAALVSTPVLRFAGNKPWTMLGTNYYPWFSNTRVVWKEDLEAPWTRVLADANDFIDGLLT